MIIELNHAVNEVDSHIRQTPYMAFRLRASNRRKSLRPSVEHLFLYHRFVSGKIHNDLNSRRHTAGRSRNNEAYGTVGSS